MFTKIKKILPITLSILIFGAVFVILNLSKKEFYEPEIQLSPKNYLFNEKFGNVIEYSSKEITVKGNVTNVRINNLPGVSEPVIKKNPVYENNFIVSTNNFSIDNNIARIFISESNGMDWESVDVKLSDEFGSSSYSDTWIEFDITGKLYLTAVQYDIHRIKNNGVFFSRSDDGGKNWNNQPKLFSINKSEHIKADKPKIFINKENNIFVYWTEVYGYNSFVKISISKDNGNTFSEPRAVTGSKAQLSSITEDKSGNLYLTYLNANELISILKSTDEGVSWVNTGLELNIISSGKIAENKMVLKSETGDGIRVNSGLSVVMSEDEEMLITYSARGNRKDLSDIYFVNASLRSNKFTSPLRVNSDDTGNDQYLPVISKDTKGNIYIFYQDSRNDFNNVLSESFVSVSTDGGRSFSDKNISTASHSPSNVAVDKYFGDYNSFVISGNNLIAVWTDGRNGNFDLYSGIVNTDYLLDR